VSSGQLQLRDVPGPTALGGGLRRSLELLYLMAVTEFKRTYFGTVLGYLWSLCRPLLLFAVLLEVFTHLLRYQKTVSHYPVLLLMGIVLFGFFQEATNLSVTSIVSNEGIVRKTQFPRLVIPLSVVLTSTFNLLLNLIVVFIFLLAFGINPMWTWLLLPVVVLALGLFATAVAMILSSLYPRFRDVAIIWAVFSTALFYATPVLYPLQKLSGKMQSIIDSSAPVSGGLLRIVVPLVIYVATLVFAVWIFNREAPRIAEAL
jgi:ABC-2 type transport system permease protein